MFKVELWKLSQNMDQRPQICFKCIETYKFFLWFLWSNRKQFIWLLVYICVKTISNLPNFWVIIILQCVENLFLFRPSGTHLHEHKCQASENITGKLKSVSTPYTFSNAINFNFPNMHIWDSTFSELHPFFLMEKQLESYSRSGIT